MMHFHLDDDEELVIRQVQFHDLVQILKGERSANPRSKLFESHLLNIPENKKKIREADKVITCISLLNSASAASMSDVYHSFNFLPFQSLPGTGGLVLAVDT